MGKTPARNTSAFWNGTNAWVSISDLTSSHKYISQTREHITDESIAQTGIKKVPKDTLLMSFKLSLGKVAIAGADIYTNEAIMAFLDKKIYDVDIHFMYHYFQAIDWTIGTNKAVKGITLNKKVLSEKVIELPSIAVQHKIAERMDTLNTVMENLQRQLCLLDELVKSQFVEMFGDPNDPSLSGEKKSIEDVCDNIYGGGTPSKSHKEYYTGNIPWVTPKDMKTLSLDDSQDHITIEAIENSSTNLIPEKSILMVIRSGILKHTLPVAINNVKVTINQDMKAFVPSSILTSEYLLHAFKMMEASILSRVRGVTADNIEFNELKKRRIVVPSIMLQNQFAAFVEQADKSKLVLRQLLEKQKTLKAALMQEYFS